MRKSILTLFMIGGTAVCAAAMVWKPSEVPVEARIVTVQRGDVHKVTSITGRIVYADEYIAYAGMNGIVSHICVEPGQRVGAGEALARLDTSQQDQLTAAYAANKASISERIDEAWLVQQRQAMDRTVVRAEHPATVRQLLVEENTPVSMGAPILRLTSGQQEIVCTVIARDAASIHPGMWAWISVQDEPFGVAKVIEVGALTADSVTGMEIVSVTLAPEQHLDLQEGTAVDAEVYLAGSDDVLTLPIEAITEQGTVWWVSEGRCTEIPVEIVMTDEILAWVDLPEGIRVAIGEFEEGQYVREARE